MRNISFYGVILVIVHFSCTASAQQTPLDSLYSAWKNPSRGDSMRIDAFYRYISTGFLESQPDSAFALAQEMIRFSKAQGYRKGEVNGLIMMGLAYDTKDNYAKALECLRSSLAIAEELDYQKEMAASLNHIGNIYYHQGYYPKALESYQRSLEIDEKLGNQLGIAAGLNNIGIIYYELADYPKALDYYYRCLKIGETLSNQVGNASTLTNIGAIHHLQGNYPKALEYYQRSLEIDKKEKSQVGIAIDLVNIGENYAIQGNYSRAEEHYQQSLTILEEVGEQEGMVSLLVNLGKIYLPQGAYPRALRYCKKAWALAVKIGTLEKQKSACQCLYDTYKAMGRGNEALFYLEKIRGIEDSLQKEETAKMLQQMEFQKLVLQDSVATAEEKKMLEEAHREEVRKKNRTKNLFLASGILLLLAAGGLYSRVRYIRKSKAVLQAEKDRSENLLLNILPGEIAAELKEKGRAEPRNFDKVSILFSDFKSFTERSEQLSAAELVNEINHCFSAFDSIIEKHGIEKIKTIGDAYMAAGGLPLPSVDSVKNILLAALEMQEFITKRKAGNEAQGKPAFEMRVGIHTGPVVAGIVGARKFQYDIWGDTVNTASRIESSGEAGKVNISQATYEMVKDDPAFVFENRGIIKAKGKGEIQMWFISKRKHEE